MLRVGATPAHAYENFVAVIRVTLRERCNYVQRATLCYIPRFYGILAGRPYGKLCKVN